MNLSTGCSPLGIGNGNKHFFKKLLDIPKILWYYTKRLSNRMVKQECWQII